MIHVCFPLYDKTGTYSRFTGTAMLSLFENHDTPPHLPSITVHLLHDNTLTDDNRDKLIQIAERYGQSLKFYNVEELCADRLAEIKEYFPNFDVDRYSFAAFYRFFIPQLLSQGIEKAIYLDSDIIVNLDIAELWQVELENKPLGAVPEIDIGLSLKRSGHPVGEGVVKEEDYFNAGVLLMNLKILRDEEATISAGMKFISENPQFKFIDQDILNYCFSTSYLKLPVKFDCFVNEFARRNDEWAIDKKIYHYVDMKFSFRMDTNDPYSRLFMDYFIKTPLIDDDTRAALTRGLLYRKNYCVSVVIPMYNAAEFIGECLDSLLIQTFQDFEVIIVDDCSTDDSVAIVEEYAPKFNGRLKLTKTKENSGNDCVPRNIGMMLARGEYIQFIDADDMILGTAFETLYKAAILYEADVVYTASCYYLRAPNDVLLYKDGTSKKIPTVQTKFTFDDPTTNLNRLLLEPGEGNFHGACTKFVRRDFLIENKLFFPNLSIAGDFIWVINIYCHVRRFLRIATPLYLYRTYNSNSMLRTNRPPKEQYRHYFFAFVDFTRALYELEKEQEILAENPEYCLEAIKKLFAMSLNQTGYARKELDSKELYKVLHDEFAKSYPDSSAMLLPFLFSSIDNEKSNELLINKCKPFITARIDIKLLTAEGDFQIVSVSDRKAAMLKPSWFNIGGIGYEIHSFAGKLEIVAKPTVNGQVILNLRGMWVPNLEDKSKLIPYWIDYTKLIVNDRIIFDTLTPAWHNKPYVYNMAVKADEEIKIQMEWLPHRSDN